jgi:hypothetical protein
MLANAGKKALGTRLAVILPETATHNGIAGNCGMSKGKLLFILLTCACAGVAAAAPVNISQGPLFWDHGLFASFAPGGVNDYTCRGVCPTEDLKTTSVTSELGTITASAYGRVDTSVFSTDDTVMWDGTSFLEVSVDVDTDPAAGYAHALAQADIMRHAIELEVLEPVIFTGNFALGSYQSGAVIMPGIYLFNTRLMGSIQVTADAGESAYLNRLTHVQYMFQAVPAASVPAPATGLLLLPGLAAAVVRKRRKRAASSA